MTLVEFSAWFEGFIENLSGPPDAKQWERIKARVKEIDNKPITEHHFINHYWPPAYPRPYWGYITPSNPWYTSTWCNTGDPVIGNANMTAAQSAAQFTSFNSSVAMGNLGRAEAQQFSSYKGYETLSVADAINQ